MPNWSLDAHDSLATIPFERNDEVVILLQATRLPELCYRVDYTWTPKVCEYMFVYYCCLCYPFIVYTYLVPFARAGIVLFFNT